MLTWTGERGQPSGCPGQRWVLPRLGLLAGLLCVPAGLLLGVKAGAQGLKGDVPTSTKAADPSAGAPVFVPPPPVRSLVRPAQLGVAPGAGSPTNHDLVARAGKDGLLDAAPRAEEAVND